MDVPFILKGAILGFLVAAPVGPIGILCIKKTLQYGRVSGLYSGLGAAVADTFYGVIAAFGLTLLSNFLLSQQFWLRAVGGFFLLYLGIRTFFSTPSEKTTIPSCKTRIQDFISTFFLTITNPMTIFSYLAIFAGLGLSDTPNKSIDAFWLVLGVFIGSLLWWIILSEGVTLFRKKVNYTMLLWIHRIAGVLITGFGIGVCIPIVNIFLN